MRIKIRCLYNSSGFNSRHINNCYNFPNCIKSLLSHQQGDQNGVEMMLLSDNSTKRAFPTVPGTSLRRTEDTMFWDPIQINERWDSPLRR